MVGTSSRKHEVRQEEMVCSWDVVSLMCISSTFHLAHTCGASLHVQAGLFWVRGKEKEGKERGWSRSSFAVVSSRESWANSPSLPHSTNANGTYPWILCPNSQRASSFHALNLLSTYQSWYSSVQLAIIGLGVVIVSMTSTRIHQNIKFVLFQLQQALFLLH
jgi:hypothetical protein